MQEIHPDDVRLSWEGAVSVQFEDGWAMPWRLPYRDARLFPPEGLSGKGMIPAGVRLTFRSETRSIRLRTGPTEAEGQLDLYCDRIFQQRVALGPNAAELAFDDLSAGEKTIEIYLPVTTSFRLTGLMLDDSATLSKAEDHRKRWITYGSSISQCGGAESPSQTWPAIVSRAKNLHLTSLGYGGNAHAEPMVARMIRGLPADYLSFCFGINIQGGATLGPRTFQAAVIGFIQIAREKHPKTPMAICSPIISPPRETTDNIVGLSLTKMRDQIREAVAIMQERGDDQIHYIDGLKLFGPEEVKYLPDQTHPNAEGYKVLARRFEAEVMPKLGL